MVMDNDFVTYEPTTTAPIARPADMDQEHV